MTPSSDPGRLRIAIVGAGISGLTAAYLLAERHDIVLFEAADYPGGHTHTVDIETPRGTRAVDTGFIVFNDRNYPLFTRLLSELSVARQPTSMSFSVRCESTGMEYQGSSVNGLFARRRNALSPSFLGMLRDIWRFGREAPALLEQSPPGPTLGAYLQTQGYGHAFRDHYLIPMGAALWSAPPAQMLEFPARYFVEFFHHHGMLTLGDRPNWFVVRGGSREYVRSMCARIGDRLQLNTKIQAIRRDRDGVEITAEGAESRRFDRVVIATHSDQALDLLADPSPDERDVLGAIPYQENDAVLHRDTSMLPRRRRAWASWNYLIPRAARSRVAVTYHMNMLQSLPPDQVFNVSLNWTDRIRSDHTYGSFTYHHPVYSIASRTAQQKKARISGPHHTYYCGAYWGYGFHEDGVRSAVEVASQMGIRWTS